MRGKWKNILIGILGNQSKEFFSENTDDVDTTTNQHEEGSLREMGCDSMSASRISSDIRSVFLLSDSLSSLFSVAYLLSSEATFNSVHLHFLSLFFFLSVSYFCVFF